MAEEISPCLAQVIKINESYRQLQRLGIPVTSIENMPVGAMSFEEAFKWIANNQENILKFLQERWMNGQLRT